MSEIVLGRLEYAEDLHVADAVYHLACSVNFRTGKQVPRQHCSDDSSDKNTKRPRQGRRVDIGKATAFLKVVKFLEENDEEQITIADLVNKMQEYLEGPEEQAYSAVYMKEKLKEHFEDKIWPRKPMLSHSTEQRHQLSASSIVSQRRNFVNQRRQEELLRQQRSYSRVTLRT